MRNILELASEAKDMLRRTAGDRPLLAFSGGKDSIVACHIAAQIGIRVAVCEESFCYPQQMVSNRIYVSKLGLHAEHLVSLDLDWLRRNRHVVFADDRRARARAIFYRQRMAVLRHAKYMRATSIISGNRLGGGWLVYSMPSTLDCDPIEDWTTDEVWAYMDTFNLGKPWFYQTEMSQHSSNGPFYSIKASDFGGEDACWKLTAKHEPAFNKSILEADTHVYTSPYRFSGVKS